MGDLDNSEGLLLGRHTPVLDSYAPQLLYPIPRSEARDRLGLGDPLPFTGVDWWHAYELSWLDTTGRPVARVGRFSVPASSPNMVESKSFKLYLNSLNNMRFDGDEQAVATMIADIGAVAGEPVSLQLWQADDAALAGASLPGTCLDDLDVSVDAGEPEAAMLAAGPQATEEQLYSHLLRSLCPVTGQPDWATLWLHYRGPTLDHSALLRYIVAYRQHQEYHEQCVERMFRDIQQCCSPDFLHIQAFYTRRGGLDINPFRSTDPAALPRARLNRQ